MEWEAYLAGLLTAEDRQRAERLVKEYGQAAASQRVRFHLMKSNDELEDVLRRNRRRVRSQVPGLYESIDVRQCPAGWSVADDRPRESDGTLLIRSDVIGPNGANGFFERGFNADQQRLELRNAFLRHRGMSDGLPGWVTGVGIPLDATRGTPTVHYFTLHQCKLLRVPAGRIRWWRRLMYRLKLRSGPFAEPGVLRSIEMSTIQNVETIVHLHWLRQRYPGVDLSELIGHTASVEYAETSAIQCGYRIAETKYVVSGEEETRIGDLLEFFEAGNQQRKAESDTLLARYSFDRQTVMKWNFGIELSVLPV